MAFEFIHEEVEKRRQQHLLRAPVILEEEHHNRQKDGDKDGSSEHESKTVHSGCA